MKARELSSILPPCVDCGLCPHGLRFRGSINCKVHVEHHARDVANLVIHRLWAISSLFNVAFRQWGVTMKDDEDYTRFMLDRAKTMHAIQNKAAAILRCKDIKLLDDIRKEQDNLYFGENVK